MARSWLMLGRWLDWRLLGLVTLTTFYLLPALQTGYWSEDCSHSVGTVGRLILKTEDSLLAVMINNIRGSIALGRFFPLTPALINLVFYLIRDVVAYKAYLIGVTVFDIVVFYYLIRRLSGNRDFACLGGCVTITLFQFRVSVDPLLAYYGQIQLVTACLLLSLMALDLYLEGRGWRWLPVSAGGYLLCTLAYEATYTLFVLHLFLIARARRQWQERLRPALPFLAVVGLCALMSFVVQRLNPSDLYVHQKSFAPGPFLTAMARQISTALPLSYFQGDRQQVFARIHGVRSLCKWVAEPGSIAVALGALVLCRACLRRQALVAELPARVRSLLAVLALMLIVVPVPLIAISPSHQQQFSFGVGWIIVVMECLGVGLLVATMIWWWLGDATGASFARKKSLGVALIVAILTGMTYRANLEVATCFSAPPGSPNYNSNAALHGASYQRQRLNLESALDAGLMDDVPSGSTLLLANVYPLWHDSTHGVFFYAKHTRKFFVIEGQPRTVPSSSTTYRIRDVCLGPRSGFVVLSHVGTDNSGTHREILVYVRRPGLGNTAESTGFIVEGEQSAIPGRSSATGSVVARSEMSLVRAGRDWGLFSLRNTSDRIVADRVRPVFNIALARSQGRSDLPGFSGRGPVRR